MLLLAVLQVAVGKQKKNLVEAPPILALLVAASSFHTTYHAALFYRKRQYKNMSLGLTVVSNANKVSLTLNYFVYDTQDIKT